MIYVYCGRRGGAGWQLTRPIKGNGIVMMALLACDNAPSVINQ